MNKYKTFQRFKKMLNEGQKPDIVDHIEQCFGDKLWDTEWNYVPSESDFQLLFNIINHDIFGGKLPNTTKVLLKEELIPSGPKKYRGMENAMAGFLHGYKLGKETEIILVKHTKKDNFFILICSIIHEMIHMYDYHFGYMRKQLEKYAAVCRYNFNYPDPFTGIQAPPSRTDPSAMKIRQMCNVRNAQLFGLSGSQLPDELIDKILHPGVDMRPRQYAYPGRIRKLTDIRTGEDFERPSALPIKYNMHPVDGFYDVHGEFFKKYADIANSMGFGITDVFDSHTPRKMRKVFEQSETRPETEMILRFFKTNDVKQVEIRDIDNWFFGIS